MSGRIADHVSAKSKGHVILYGTGSAGKKGVVKSQQSMIKLALGLVCSFLRKKQTIRESMEGRALESAPVILLYLIPINFPISGLGQGVHEDDVFRFLVPGDFRCHELDKLFGLQ